MCGILFFLLSITKSIYKVDVKLFYLQVYVNRKLFYLSWMLKYFFYATPNYQVVCVCVCVCVCEFNLMMVSHDLLVPMYMWKTNNLFTWRDYSRYFYNELEYGVIR